MRASDLGPSENQASGIIPRKKFPKQFLPILLAASPLIFTALPPKLCFAREQSRQLCTLTKTTVKSVYNGPVYNGHPIFPKIVPYIYCKVDLYTVKPVYNGPVYNGHPVYHGHRTTSQKSCLTFTVKLTCIQRSPVYNGRGLPLDFPNAQFHYLLTAYNGHQSQ